MTEEKQDLEPVLGDIQGMLEVAAAEGVDRDVIRVRNRLLNFMHSPRPVPNRRWNSRLLVAFAVLVPTMAAALLTTSILGVFRPKALFKPVPAAPTPSVRPTPLAPAEALVVTTDRAPGDTNYYGLGITPDTVFLSKNDGTVVAKATFTPSVRPTYTNAATIMPPQVEVAAGAAYYIDGDGVVRRLDRDGTVSVIASFKTTEPQHMTSFAVSPDGSKLMATVFTFGAKGPDFSRPTIGPSYDNLEYADAGGQTRVILHTPLAATTGHFMVVGWDQQGPLVGTNVQTATQAAPPEGLLSPVYHLSMSGNTTDRVGGSDCFVALLAQGGNVLCAGSAYQGLSAQVRTQDGASLYSLPSDAINHYSAAISSTGDRVAFQSWPAPTSSNHIYGRGYVAAIPNDFYSVGWEDGQTLVGYMGSTDHPTLAKIDMSGGQPAPARNFPHNGFYVGVILAQDRNPTEGP